MDTLPVTPSISSRGNESARVLRNKFSGYTQRAPDGLNSIEATWDMRWDNITVTEANTLIAFFRAKLGAEAFFWTPPGEPQPWVWTCDKWSKDPPEGPYTNMSATFTREFDPV